MDVNEALEMAGGSAMPWAPVLAAEVQQLRELVAHVESESATTERERDAARAEVRRLQSYEAMFARAREVALRPVGTWSGPEAAHYILGDWTPP